MYGMIEMKGIDAGAALQCKSRQLHMSWRGLFLYGQLTSSIGARCDV